MKKLILLIIITITIGSTNTNAQSAHKKRVKEYEEKVLTSYNDSDINAAVSYAKEALSNGYKSPIFYNVIVRSIAISNPVEGEKMLIKALTEYPKEPAFGKIMASFCLVEGNIGATYKKLAKAFADHPQNAILGDYAASYANKLGNIGAALEIYKKMLDSDANNFNALLYSSILIFNRTVPIYNEIKDKKGTAQYTCKIQEIVTKYKEVKSLLERAHEIDPDNEDVNKELKSINKCLSCLNPSNSEASDESANNVHTPKKRCKLYIDNSTGEELNLALQVEINGKRETKYWYTFKPWEKSYMFYVSNERIYYYAKTSTHKWSGKDALMDIDGSGKGLIRKIISEEKMDNGVYTLTLKIPKE